MHTCMHACIHTHRDKKDADSGASDWVVDVLINLTQTHTCTHAHTGTRRTLTAGRVTGWWMCLLLWHKHTQHTYTHRDKKDADSGASDWVVDVLITLTQTHTAHIHTHRDKKDADSGASDWVVDVLINLTQTHTCTHAHTGTRKTLTAGRVTGWWMCLLL